MPRPGSIVDDRACWNGHIVAESARTVVVEGNHYFPVDSVRPGVLEASRSRSLCRWKGFASYFDVVVAGIRCPNGAWCYRHPTPLARRIKGHIAFWRGVEVTLAPTRSRSGVPVQSEHLAR